MAESNRPPQLAGPVDRQSNSQKITAAPCPLFNETALGLRNPPSIHLWERVTLFRADFLWFFYHGPLAVHFAHPPPCRASGDGCRNWVDVPLCNGCLRRDDCVLYHWNLFTGHDDVGLGSLGRARRHDPFQVRPHAAHRRARLVPCTGRHAIRFAFDGPPATRQLGEQLTMPLVW